MGNYYLVKVKNDNYKYLVIATNYISPISQLTDIQNALGNISGSILFDLTLINGTNSNRYLSASIVNGVFERHSFRKATTVDDDIRSISKSFFMENTETVDNGTITRALKYLLKTGENI